MATRLVPTLYQVLTDEGEPASGYLLYFYTTGTTTLKDTYSDEALLVANTNPVVADSSGRFVDIWGEDKDDYKVILKTSADVVIDTQDPVDDVSPSINAFSPRPAQQWGITTNTADAYRIKPDPSITAYSNDLLFSFTCHLDNNAGCTFAVFQEGTVGTYLSALTMKKYDMIGAKTNLEALDMQAGQTYIARIDSANVILLNPDKPKFRNATINELLQINKILNLQTTAQTIVSDEITFVTSNMLISPEGGVPDDLDTINGGNEGDILIMNIAGANAITLIHSASLDLAYQLDVILNDGNDSIVLKCASSGNWAELSRTVRNDNVAFDSIENVTVNKVLNVKKVSQAIVSGVVAFTYSNVVLQAQSGTTDDFDGFSGGAVGDRVRITPDTGDTITIKHSATFDLENALDVKLNDGNDSMDFECKSAGSWKETGRSLINSFRSGSGYYYLPNNRLVQFGKYAGGAAGPTITFGIAFDSIDSVVGNVNATGAAMLGIDSSPDISATSFVGNQYTDAGATTTNAFYWMAIGIKAQ